MQLGVLTRVGVDDPPEGGLEYVSKLGSTP